MKRNKQRVYVLGAGPAGLLAAHAAIERGYDVQIFSKPGPSGIAAKSQLYGCQYLHAPVPTPHVAGPANKVVYTLSGTINGYRQKVYGATYHGTVSPDEYGPEVDHEAWDLRQVYDQMWQAYMYDIVPTELGPGQVSEMLETKPRLIISTIPAPALCVVEEHRFSSADIWAYGEAPGRRAPVEVPPFTVVCNGDPDRAWYRAANVYGHTTVEWPGRRKPPIDGVVAVSKPVSTDCNCWTASKRFVRAGRFGRWTKGVLVHEAYEQTLEMLR